MDLVERHAELGIDIPTERRAEQTGTKVVQAIVGIAHHHGKVFWYVLKKDMQRMHFFNDGLFIQDAIVEDVAFRLGQAEREVLWVAGAQKLNGKLHDLLAG